MSIRPRKIPTYIFNEMRLHAVKDQPDRVDFVRAWKDGREYVVQVWIGMRSPEGEPDGDWTMPGILGLTASIAQAVVQTTKKKSDSK